MDYAGLKAEIAKPAYASMTDAQIATAINTNTVTTQLSPMQVNGAQIYNAIVPAEFTALSTAQQQLVRDVFGLGDGIDVSAGTNARTVLANAFGAATVSRANLLAMTALTQTIAHSLGFSSVNDQEVLAARKWSAS
jgi:hypothetical protein